MNWVNPPIQAIRVYERRKKQHQGRGQVHPAAASKETGQNASKETGQKLLMNH